MFESLPNLVRQIIEHKTWRTYNKTNFADYVLDETTNGLGVNSNQRLWMLRCAMDANGAHLHEWTEIIAKVEMMVRVEAVKGGKQLGSRGEFNGNSLEVLAKNGRLESPNKITYLPSRSRHGDAKLLRIAKKPALFRQLAAGKISMDGAMKKISGRSDANHLSQAKYYIKKLDDDQLDALVKWMKEEGKL